MLAMLSIWEKWSANWLEARMSRTNRSKNAGWHRYCPSRVQWLAEQLEEWCKQNPGYDPLQSTRDDQLLSKYHLPMEHEWQERMKKNRTEKYRNNVKTWWCAGLGTIATTLGLLGLGGMMTMFMMMFSFGFFRLRFRFGFGVRRTAGTRWAARSEAWIDLVHQQNTHCRFRLLFSGFFDLLLFAFTFSFSRVNSSAMNIDQIFRVTTMTKDRYLEWALEEVCRRRSTGNWWSWRREQRLSLDWLEGSYGIEKSDDRLKINQFSRPLNPSHTYRIHISHSRLCYPILVGECRCLKKRIEPCARDGGKACEQVENRFLQSWNALENI